MSDLAQQTTTRQPGGWQAEAAPDPDLEFGGNQGGMEEPRPDPDQDMPGDPPMADAVYGGNQGGSEEPPPDPDQDMPIPPPEVAETNGR